MPKKNVPKKKKEAEFVVPLTGPKQTCPQCGMTFTCPASLHAQFCRGGARGDHKCNHCGEENMKELLCKKCAASRLK